MAQVREEAITGCLLGMAVADALGTWCEGLRPARIQRFCTRIEGHRLLCGRGMFSDDTEHLCLVAQALIVSAGEPQRFLHSLGWKLRGWFLGISAGIGYATLRACTKLCLGWPPTRSGVWSAGNGPAMRSPLLGVCFGDDPPRLRELVRLSTRITHTDPKAEHGALAVALAAHLASTQPEPATLCQRYRVLIEQTFAPLDPELHALLQRAIASADAGQSASDFATELKLHKKGVTGYMYHTVPMVIQCWLRAPTDYRSAVEAIILRGGDADTTAAILGAILGAGLGKSGIPRAWLDGLWEWPRSVHWIERLGQRLAEVCVSRTPLRSLPVFLPGVVLRNLFFLAVVLVHACRRALPPY